MNFVIVTDPFGDTFPVNLDQVTRIKSRTGDGAVIYYADGYTDSVKETPFQIFEMSIPRPITDGVELKING